MGKVRTAIRGTLMTIGPLTIVVIIVGSILLGIGLQNDSKPKVIAGATLLAICVAVFIFLVGYAIYVACFYPDTPEEENESALDDESYPYKDVGLTDLFEGRFNKEDKNNIVN